jgi:hypothetical protein
MGVNGSETMRTSDSRLRLGFSLLDLRLCRESAIDADGLIMSWQEVLRQRLVDRNIRESSHGPLIEQCMSRQIDPDFQLILLILQTGDLHNIQDC